MRGRLSFITSIIAILVLLSSVGCAKKFVDSRILLDDTVRAKPVEAAKKPKPKPDTVEIKKPEKVLPPIIEERIKEEKIPAARVVEPEVAKPEEIVKGIQDIFFDYDRFYVRDEAELIMEKNAGYLKENTSFKIIIEGYCDERGTAEYNIALGESRAQAAKEYLLKSGIAPTRISTISYGKERPFCTEHNEDCWQANRRVHFVIE
ncbi:MAG: peptidoglycan-associated lipoprotein Pal [Deltaproteobacteria bacterium]|nr:peptidoglycan-associated lipoprotein Pal [Deltaproteobacteria bacterium]